MDRPLSLQFRPGDLLAAGAVLLCAAGLGLGLWAGAAPAETLVQIRQDGALVRELPLSEDAVLDLEGAYRNTVTIHNGKVAVTASDCPGADCVHSGWLSAPGRSIVCLPNRVEVRLVGGDSDGVDGVTG